MKEDRKNLLKNLLNFVETHRLASKLNVDPKTIRNWVLGVSPCPEYAIIQARKLIIDKYPAFTAYDYLSYAYDGDRVVARLRSTSTYHDRDKLLYYFYRNIEDLEKIILFSRSPGKDELNQYIFGCAIETASEVLVCDTSSMTACRRPRQLEIMDLFKHMVLNGFIDIMFYNCNTLPVLEDQSVSVSYKFINDPDKLVNISKNSLKDYLTLISGTKLNVEEFFSFEIQDDSMSILNE